MTYTVLIDLVNGKHIEIGELPEHEKAHIMSAIQCRADSNYMSNPFLEIHEGFQLVNCKHITLVTVVEHD